MTVAMIAAKHGHLDKLPEIWKHRSGLMHGSNTVASVCM